LFIIAAILVFPVELIGIVLIRRGRRLLGWSSIVGVLGVVAGAEILLILDCFGCGRGWWL
jgi:hypothetical protein